MLKKFLKIFIMLLISKLVFAAAKNTNLGKFSLQNFLNSEQTLDFLTKSGYSTLRAFVIQKHPHGAFNNFNIDEANEFYAVQTPADSIRFDRSYKMLSKGSLFLSGGDYQLHMIRIYPVRDALKKVISTCRLQNAELTAITIVSPSTVNYSIYYDFNFKAKDNWCRLYKFNTFNKKIVCRDTVVPCFYRDL